MVNAEPYGRKKPGCWKNSFLQLSTMGQRNSPVELLLELYRSIFYKDFSGDSKRKGLKLEDYNAHEQVTLLSFQGRLKESGLEKGHPYFACPYPRYAKHTWERKQAERPLMNFLFHGALAQHAFQPGPGSEKDFEEKDLPKIIQALAGTGGRTKTDFFACDPLENTLGDKTENDAFKDLLTDIRDFASKEQHSFSSSSEGDPLAERIYKDFVYLCEQEAVLSRYHWIQLLLGFLSIASCSWLLSHMKLTVYMRDWLVDALDRGMAPSEEDIKACFKARSKNLLTASSQGSRDIYQHVETYAKARVELLVLLEKLVELKLINDSKPIPSDPRKLEAFFNLRVNDRGHFSAKINPLQIRDYLTREGENYSVWRMPREAYGFGKAANEYLSVLRKPKTSGINESYLLIPEKARLSLSAETWHKVLPGPITLQLFIFLSIREKQEKKLQGPVTMDDLINHFEAYGIDFGQTDDGVQILKDELRVAGLMKGSPDAGKNAQLETPFELKK